MDMSGIIDRCARKLHTFYKKNKIVGMREIAELVIQEMREPTEAMIHAGDAARADDGSRRSGAIWRAMIDAALKESA